MICFIARLFKRETPERTVSRNSLVVPDIDFIENYIVSELRVYKDGQTVRFSFLPPKTNKAKSHSTYCTKHLLGISWNSGYRKVTKLENNLTNLVVSETDFVLAKLYEKCETLSEFSETKLTSLNDYARPKNQNLFFKDENYDWSCSKYLFWRPKTHHCAERKAVACRCFFNKTYVKINFFVILFLIFI